MNKIKPVYLSSSNLSEDSSCFYTFLFHFIFKMTLKLYTTTCLILFSFTLFFYTTAKPIDEKEESEVVTTENTVVVFSDDVQENTSPISVKSESEPKVEIDEISMKESRLGIEVKHDDKQVEVEKVEETTTFVPHAER